MSRAGLLMIVGVLATPARAERQLEPAVASPQPSVQQVALEVGIASPIGSIGVTYQRELASRFVIEAGVGYGVTGMQLEAMPKVVLAHGTCRYLVSAGASLALFGNYAEPGPSHQPQPSAIPWLDVDAEVQCGAPRELLFIAGGGFTTPLVEFHYDFADTGKTVHAREIMPVLKLGLGYRF
jgi:hypothetical protein